MLCVGMYGEYFEIRGQTLKVIIKCLLLRVFEDDSSVVMADKWLLTVPALGAHFANAAQSLD